MLIFLRDNYGAHFNSLCDLVIATGLSIVKTRDLSILYWEYLKTGVSNTYCPQLYIMAHWIQSSVTGENTVCDNMDTNKHWTLLPNGWQDKLVREAAKRLTATLKDESLPTTYNNSLLYSSLAWTEAKVCRKETLHFFKKITSRPG